MTTVVAEHPLVDAFRENGIDVHHYLAEEDDFNALIVFEGDQEIVAKAVGLVHESDVKLCGLRDARYFDLGESERFFREILFRSG